MKAYYIHWSYPTTADDEYFYGGTDDEKLFHHKENAEKYMKEILKDFLEVKEKSEILFNKEKNARCARLKTTE